MKNISKYYILTLVTAAVLFFFGSMSLKSDSALESTSDCDGYFPLQKGLTYETTSYNKKDKAEAIVSYTITDSKIIENGVIATYDMTTSDMNGNPGMELVFDAKCQNGKYYINMENLYAQLGSQYEDMGMEITISDGIAVIPNDLSVGDKLEDAVMLMNIKSDFMNMEMTITTFDRHISGQETFTTSAGTFDCMILSQKTSVKVGKTLTATTSSKEWLAKGVGNVKSESYDKKGKLESYSLLTKFSK